MSACCSGSTRAIANHFGHDVADDELRRYRQDGPLPTTRALIAALRSQGIGGSDLLDVGAGVGAIHHELLDAGAFRAVHVDISPAHVKAAREEAERRNHTDVRFMTGDFLELAPAIDAADIVTLDRVICCYHDMEALVERSAGKARRLYGAVYPRDRPWTRLVVALDNVWHRVRRSKFRSYVHPPAAIDAALRRMGLERRSVQRTWMWEVVVYVRQASPQAAA